MNKLMIILLWVGIITGCETVDTVVIPQQVDVAVFKVPEKISKLPVVDRPNLEVNKLDVADSMDHDKVIKAYIKTIAQLQTYCEQLEINEHAFRQFIKDAQAVPSLEPNK